MEWTVLENPDDVARTVCDRIVQASRVALAERGEFHLVLAGGNTPARAYEMLAAEKCDWQHWHIWFGDERCMPLGHPDRNSTMAEKTLFSKVTIPASQIHIIAAEAGPGVAARHYAALIDGALPFDMVLLGIGEDGHTASLFPGQEHQSGQSVLPIFDAPKPPALRVSLSAKALGQCRQMLFIITGQNKSAAVSRWQNGETLPVNRIHAIGKTEVIIDKLALSRNYIK